MSRCAQLRIYSGGNGGAKCCVELQKKDMEMLKKDMEQQKKDVEKETGHLINFYKRQLSTLTQRCASGLIEICGEMILIMQVCP